MTVKNPEILFLDTNSAERDMILLGLYGKKTVEGYKDLSSEDIADLAQDPHFNGSLIYWSKPPVDDLFSLEEGLEKLRSCVKILSVSRWEMKEINRIDLDLVDNFVTKPFRTNDLSRAIQKSLEIFKKKNKLFSLKSVLDESLKEGNPEKGKKAIEEFPKKKSAMFCQICGDFYQEQGDFRKAFSFYSTGLKRNKFHKGCLTGLFNLIYLERNYGSAAYISKVMLSNTLVDKKVFLLILRLSLSIALRDKKLLRMVVAYFKEYFNKDAEVKRQMGFAMFVVIKNSLKELTIDELEEDVFMINHAGSSAPALLLELIEILFESEQKIKINAVLRSFSKSALNSAEFKRASFYKEIQNVSDYRLITQLVRELLEEGYQSPLFVEAVKLYYYGNYEKYDLKELEGLLRGRGLLISPSRT